MSTAAHPTRARAAEPGRRSAPATTAIGLALLAVYGLLVNTATTQVLAARFAYQPALGVPLMVLPGGTRVYPPWAWLSWLWQFSREAPKPFYLAELGVVLAMAVGVLTYTLVLGFRLRSARRHEGVHGTAHWATEAEIRATGLLPEAGEAGSGVYVGGWTDEEGRLHYLRHDGPEHVLGIAPTRSGKGLGLVIPTLLSWPHSALVNDPKTELWNLTAGWRRSGAGNRVLKFDPTAVEGGVGFNPLNEVRIGTAFEVGDVQNLVTIMVDPEGKGLDRLDHWAKTSHAFLSGLVLHLQHRARKDGREVGLPDVAFAISDPARPVEALYHEMLENEHLGPGEPHPVVAAAARDQLDRPADEAGSVLSTCKSLLALYRDPLVARNISHSDFRVNDLMNADRPVSLYITTRAEDKDRLKPLTRLVINQIMRVLLRPEITFADGRPVMPHRHRLLFLPDEFASYGKLDIIQESLAYIAGYGIKAYLLVQDIAQLWDAYGHDEQIVSNCHIRVAYAPNKIETGEWMSKQLGTTTVVKEDISTSGARFGAVLQQVNRAYHEISRPLLQPDEVMRLRAPAKTRTGQITEPGDVLVFVAGHAPILGTQSLYFRDPVFAERARVPVPLSDVLRPVAFSASAAALAVRVEPFRSASAAAEKPAADEVGGRGGRRQEDDAPAPGEPLRVGTRRRDDQGRQRSLSIGGRGRT